MRKIQEGRSVSIHIRRGDYVNIGWAYTLENYRYMVDSFLENCGTGWDLFVFSDYMAWCRDNREALGFHNFRTVHFIDGNIKERSYIDMQLMSRCKAMIMSNSAFCYLAALLNTRKEFIINPTTREV